MFPKWKRSWEVVLSVPNPLPASLSHATQTTSQLRERKDQLEGVRWGGDWSREGDCSQTTCPGRSGRITEALMHVHGSRQTAGPLGQNARHSLNAHNAVESAVDITPVMSLQVSSLLPNLADLTSRSPETLHLYPSYGGSMGPGSRRSGLGPRSARGASGRSFHLLGNCLPPEDLKTHGQADTLSVSWAPDEGSDCHRTQTRSTRDRAGLGRSGPETALWDRRPHFPSPPAPAGHPGRGSSAAQWQTPHDSA